MKYIGKKEIIEYQGRCSEFAQRCLHEIIKIVSLLPNREIHFDEDLDNAYAFVVEKNEMSSVV